MISPTHGTTHQRRLYPISPTLSALLEASSRDSDDRRGGPGLARSHALVGPRHALRLQTAVALLVGAVRQPRHLVRDEEALGDVAREGLPLLPLGGDDQGRSLEAGSPAAYRDGERAEPADELLQLGSPSLGDDDAPGLVVLQDEDGVATCEELVRLTGGGQETHTSEESQLFLEFRPKHRVADARPGYEERELGLLLGGVGRRQGENSPPVAPRSPKKGLHEH